jgi:hypothetical protein
MSVFLFAVLYFRDGTAYEKVSAVLYPEANGQKAAVANLQLHYYLFHAKAFFASVGKAVATLFGYWEPLTKGLLRVIAMSGMGLAIITAFAIFYSTFSTPTLSAVFTFLTFVIGSLCEDILRYADKIVEKAGGAANLVGPDLIKYWFAVGAMQIVPNLAYFDKRTEAIYGPDAMAVPAVSGPLIDDWMAVTYGVCYTAAVLCLASLIFKRRNFK